MATTPSPGAPQSNPLATPLLVVNPAGANPQATPAAVVGVGNPTDEIDKRRSEFLQKMYVQMFDDIKLQLQVVWQAVTVVAGTFAIFALVEKGVIPLDVAVAIVVLIASWLIAHVIEASYWYNRNLVIIANIERQFLRQDDLREIHYYFGKHRRVGTMIYHLWVQLLFGLSIGFVILFYHFSVQVLPGIEEPWGHFEVTRAIPYFMALVAAIFLWRHKLYKDGEYQEFLTNSPGKAISTGGIVYGTGHPAQP